MALPLLQLRPRAISLDMGAAAAAQLASAIVVAIRRSACGFAARFEQFYPVVLLSLRFRGQPREARGYSIRRERPLQPGRHRQFAPGLTGF